ncbi:MAG: glycosyltransferase family 4 protein [Cyanobacteria bacterium J06621_8]
MKACLGYLSGAPRVSTDPQAELGGARTHVLGIITAFEQLSWNVKPYIVGDKVPRKWVGKGSERAISNSFFRTLIVDLIRLIISARYSRQAWQELKGQVDWVYERCGTFQAMGRKFKYNGVPWILETNALLYEEAKFERKSLILYKLARYMEIKAYQDCDVLVCISNNLKQRLITETDISSEKILVIPNGVNLNYINPDQHPSRRLFSGFTVGFVGSLYAWSGLDLLLEVVRELQGKGFNISVVVIGDGQVKETLLEQVQKLNLVDNVKFLGQLPQKELLPILAGCDLGYSGHFDLQGKQAYRSPLKLYEYMAMAKPVLASAIEGTESVIREGQTGFLFQPNDKNSLKQALVKAFTAQNKLPEMGAEARQEIELNHSWTRRVQVLIEQSDRILKEKGN